MKKMRKLLPAFAMLLVSAIMMSTASFAWFTMSAEVSATGMEVKAQAAGGLVMSALLATGADPDSSDYAATIDLTEDKWFNNDAKNIYPTSADGTNWYKADATSATSQAAATNTYGKLPVEGIQGNENYYLATKLYFKAIEEGQAYTLSITDITVESDGANTNGILDKALRVALKVIGTDEDGEATATWFYFAPNYSAAPTTALVHTTSTTAEGTSTTTYSTAAYSNLAYGDEPDVVLCTDLLYETATEVEVYVYYEGEDPNCKSVNAVDINTLTVDLTFNAAKTESDD